MLRRVAQELHARVRVVLEPDKAADHVAESQAVYRTARRTQRHRAAQSWRTKNLRRGPAY
ncbi:MAG TPA: hypothetical protein VFU48_08465 [Nitrospira sp.]|nr:hypothetical protein [Nitrospira sp.]